MKRLLLVILSVLFFVRDSLLADSLPSPDSIPKMKSSTAAELDKAYELIEGQDLAGAEKVLRALFLKQNRTPDRQYAERALAYIALERNELPKAQSLLESALSVPALSPEVRLSSATDLAQLYLLDGKSSKAVSLLSSALGKQTPSLQTSRVLAYALVDLGKTKEALPHLERVLDLEDKLNRSTALTLVSAYNELKRYPEALKLLERMLLLWPNELIIWRQLSQTLYLSGKAKEAASRFYIAYEKGLVKEEDSLVYLAQLQAEAGSPALALSILAAAHSASAGKLKLGTLKLLAQLHAVSRNYKEAASAYEDIFKRDSSSFTSLMDASRLYLEANETKRAEEIARKLLLVSEQSKSAAKFKVQASQLIEYISQLGAVAEANRAASDASRSPNQ